MSRSPPRGPARGSSAKRSGSPKKGAPSRPSAKGGARSPGPAGSSGAAKAGAARAGGKRSAASRHGAPARSEPSRAGAAHPTSEAHTDWIGRALPRSGILSQDDATRAIREGRVSLDGRVVTQPMTLLRPGTTVRVDGQKVDLTVRTLTLMFHKPAGCLTSTRMQRLVPTVFDLLLPSLTSRLAAFHWHAVGRLDKDTTGLLLFTNDERLVGYVTSPDSRIPKRYVARVQGGAEEAKVDPLRRGIQLEDGPTRPAKVEIRDAKTVEVELTEGRHHQVKRLLGAVGLPVNALHRAAVGALELDVPEGAWREVTENEVREKLGFEL